MEFLGLNHQSVILLINVKMPTIDGILTFMSRINFMLNLGEHEKRFITSGPGDELPFNFRPSVGWPCILKIELFTAGLDLAYKHGPHG